MRIALTCSFPVSNTKICALISIRRPSQAARNAAAETRGESELRRRFEAAIELGLQFRDARVARGLSQRELAERSGVRQADVSRIERGAGNPTEATLQRLAAALKQRLERTPVRAGELMDDAISR
ncbi:MAG TPA: helix-turn-helix transcriptional regulator [Trebonia sp.]